VAGADVVVQAAEVVAVEDGSKAGEAEAVPEFKAAGVREFKVTPALARRHPALQAAARQPRVPT
jgi:hypothetical protein